jgi:hypothetical protein
MLRSARPSRGIVVGAIQSGAVMETNPVKGTQRAQVNIVLEAPVAEPPQVLEHERRGNDGRTRIEREAVLAKHIGPAARRIQLLEHAHSIAACAQSNGGRQAAEAAANDNRVCRRVSHAPEV